MAAIGETTTLYVEDVKNELTTGAKLVVEEIEELATKWKLAQIAAIALIPLMLTGIAAVLFPQYSLCCTNLMRCIRSKENENTRRQVVLEGNYGGDLRDHNRSNCFSEVEQKFNKRQSERKREQHFILKYQPVNFCTTKNV